MVAGDEVGGGEEVSDMGRVIKGALIGGGVAAGVAGFQSLQREDPSDVTRSRVVRAAVQGAVVGGAIGYLIERRVRVPKSPVEEFVDQLADQAAHAVDVVKPQALAAAALAAEAARVVRPRIEAASRVAQRNVVSATHAAKPVVVDAARSARPHLEAAGRSAQHSLASATEAAKPVMSQAARAARELAHA